MPFKAIFLLSRSSPTVVRSQEKASVEDQVDAGRGSAGMDLAVAVAVSVGSLGRHGTMLLAESVGLQQLPLIFSSLSFSTS